MMKWIFPSLSITKKLKPILSARRERKLKKTILFDSIILFEGDPAAFEIIKAYDNCVLEFKANGREHILRIIERTEEWRSYIQAELDWINYLWFNGITVCKPTKSVNQNQLEVLKLEGSIYFICCFEKAKGRFVDYNLKEDWNEDLFQEWGSLMGKMHCLTKKYYIETGNPRRMDWDCGPIYDPNFSLGKNQEIVTNKWKELIDILRKLPREQDVYGLIHYDFHHRNFFIEGENIWLFDFDDCRYCWFICDIAITLYDAVVGSTVYDNRNSFGKCFLNNFLKGYRKETDIEQYWIDQLPKFLKYRQIYTYIHYYTNWKQPDNQQKKELRSLKYLIENNIPCWD